jgi:UDP-N-acetylmuramate dehydrogenase
MPLIIQEQVSLKDKNWFATGGNARFFCEPTNSTEFQEALTFAHNHGLAIFVLGQGANILVSDDGFDGLVIRPMLKEIGILSRGTDTEVLVQAGAGVTMHDLIEYCLDHQITGLEEFSGIPGTVGGSVYINLHYFEFLLEQFLVQARVIDKNTGEIITVSPEWFNFGYDHSRLHNHDYFLINAIFRLTQTTPVGTMYARGRRAEIIRHRVRRYPATHTCGSFFRNFHDHEVTLVSNGKKMIYVAYYLDKIGVKGQLQIGDAIVSYQHANMLVNRGQATSTDIITLARRMQELVHQQFGIIPQPECQLIGFKQWPLL